MLALAAPFVQAQAIDAPLPDVDTRVLPVWSNASGRVEALLLLDAVEPTLSASALDRVLNANAQRPGLGARMQLSNGSQLRTTLNLDTDAGLALLCEGRSGLAGTLGAFGDHCLLATLDHNDPLLQAGAQGARLGLDWESPDQRVDLSFGLSWLQARPQPVALLARLDSGRAASGFLPSLDAADGFASWSRALESRSLSLDSLIMLGANSRMLIGGDLGRSRTLSIDGTPLQWETAALTFGFGVGDFSGQLTGRLIELPESGHWNTLDIGVSWRTPWRGELSVGARNVLGAEPSRWPLSELPAVEDSAARVPYVRYQQDL